MLHKNARVEDSNEGDCGSGSGQVLLSILIPTRNRFRYARSAVEGILALNNPDVEVILQDNSDKENDVNWAKTIKSETRFVYNYTPPPLSSIGNFDLAIGLSSGKYLCLIGDDDGVISDLIEATKWADENHIDAIAYDPVAFMWPGAGIKSTTFTKNVETGLLRLPLERIYAVQFDCDVGLNKLLANGLQYYNNFKVPRLYHGIVKREYFKKHHDEIGFYVGGLSPDIYSVVNLCCRCRYGVYTNFPLSIAGVCGVSTSADSLKGTHAGDLSNAPHLRYKSDYVWSKQVPRLYSVETIWADSGLAALSDLKRADLQKKYNMPIMVAFAIWNNPQLRKKFWQAFPILSRELGFGRIRGLLMIAMAFIDGPFRYFISRALNRMLLIAGLKTLKLQKNLRNMPEVMDALTEFYKTRNLNIREVLDQSLENAKNRLD